MEQAHRSVDLAIRDDVLGTKGDLFSGNVRIARVTVPIRPFATVAEDAEEHAEEEAQ